MVTVPPTIEDLQRMLAVFLGGARFCLRCSCVTVAWDPDLELRSCKVGEMLPKPRVADLGIFTESPRCVARGSSEQTLCTLGFLAKFWSFKMKSAPYFVEEKNPHKK